MKIAVDNQIARSTVRLLKSKYDVVIEAGDMQDEEWVDIGLSRGATIFISPDLDIPNYLDRVNSDAAWIDVPQNLRERNQFDYLIKQLERLKK